MMTAGLSGVRCAWMCGCMALNSSTGVGVLADADPAFWERRPVPPSSEATKRHYRLLPQCRKSGPRAASSDATMRRRAAWPDDGRQTTAITPHANSEGAKVDFQFSEEQSMLRDTLARYLADHYDFEARQAAAQSA